MKPKALFFILALIVFTNSAVLASTKGPKSSSAEMKSSFSGIVVDKTSNETLTGVTIHLLSVNQKVYSDSRGEFSLNGLEPGTYKVRINCISYKDKEVTVKVEKSQNEQLKILLNPIEP